MTTSPVLLIANRGEISARIALSAQTLGIRTVAIYTQDDASSTHVAGADTATQVPSYMDIEAVIAAGVQAGATLVHPGYGFFAESASFARAVEKAGMTFVGPPPVALEALGDKERTQSLASELGIPTPTSTGIITGPEDLKQVAELMESTGTAVGLKAVAGGGGRGIRIVDRREDLEAAFTQCTNEARIGFGDDRVFAQQWLSEARHVEVQVCGTAAGVYVLGDRDCSLQRKRQKVIEVAPADLTDSLRNQLHSASTRLLEHVGYTSLATVEFLVTDSGWYFMEVNPRIQVEHTVTEEVTGCDLVELQLKLAMGKDLDLSTHPYVPDRVAVEARLCAETWGSAESGTHAAGIDAVHANRGTISAVDFPTGRNVRVDTWIRSGTQVGTQYDSLLAKIVCTGPDLDHALGQLSRALRSVRVTGVATNLAVLEALLPYVRDARTSTLETNLARILAEVKARGNEKAATDITADAATSVAIDKATPSVPARVTLEDGERVVTAPVTGTVVSLAKTGDSASRNAGEIGVIEAMKMHHPVLADAHSAIRTLVQTGDTVTAGDPVAVIRPVDAHAGDDSMPAHAPHPGIAEVNERHAMTLDAARPQAVHKRHSKNRRTARENLADLLVPDTFVEYGALALAAQRKRRSVEDLIANTPADGLVGGIGEVATPAGPVRAVVMSYEYMVLAGTQGARNHRKTDRLLEIAERQELPVVFFVEGGGGRPGDTDIAPGTQLGVTTFAALALLRGKVPLLAIAAGRTFAGNAALAGVCDIIVAHNDANIGMGGPAMIEGGGLGTFTPEQVGPTDVHRKTGAVDIVVPDDATAVAQVQRLLGLTHGSTEFTHSGDASQTVPADRLRAFDMRNVITHVADDDSVVQLRPDYAPGAIVGFLRIEGHPFGFIANNNLHVGGAIDVDAAHSFSQHIELINSYGIPLLSFVDTPGFMVGPEAEKQPGVRAFGDLFVAGARFRGRSGAIVIRKAYGLGAMAMTLGHLQAPDFSIAWPPGELGPMGLEGAVRLGYAKELAAVDGPEREKLYTQLLDSLYAQGRALAAAEVFDIDDVIDPADTRKWALTLV